MGDVLWIRNGCADSVLGSDAGLGESIVARIEVFPILLHLHEDVLMCGKLAILGEK